MDSHTLFSVYIFAAASKEQGSLSRAITLMEDCYALWANVLGPQHPDTITSHKNVTRWRLERDSSSEMQ